MLYLNWLGNLKSKEQIWQNFNPKTDLWLVGQLRSKLALKNDLWEKHGALAFEPVLKIDDFIHTHLSLCNPEIQSLNKLASKIYLKMIMKHFDFPWLDRPGTVDWLLKEFECLFSLISSPDLEQVFQELVSEGSGQSTNLFKEVIEVLQSFLLDCKKNQRFPDFCVGHFIEIKKLSRFDRKISVDLGCSMSTIECEFLKRASKFYDFEVLVPAKSTEELVATGQTGYLDLLTFASSTKEIKPSKVETKTSVKVWHESSILGEVHSATLSVRRWISEQKVRPDRIAILSPNPEHYFPALRDYFSKEGIPFSWPQKVSFSSLKGFQVLMSRLKLLDGQLSAENLQEALDPSEFRKAPLSLVDESNLGHIPGLKSKIQSIAKDLPGKIDLHNFEKVCLRICKNVDLDEQHILTVFQGMRLELGSELDLHLRDWIWILSEKIASQGFSSETSSEWGVSFLGLEGSEECFYDYVVVLGFTQQKEPTGSLQLLKSSQRKILSDMGFDRVENKEQKFNNIVNQFISGGCNEIVLSVPVVDFTGGASAPSLLWLNWEAQVGVSSAPSGVSCYVAELNSPVSSDRLQLLVQEIRGQRKIELAQTPEFHVSASSIEEYFVCPFKFYMRSIVGLRAPEEWDLDPSAMRAGGWFHTVLEAIMKSKIPIDQWTDQMISEVLSRAGEIYLKMIPDLWKYLEPQYHRMIREFVKFETDYQRTPNAPVGKFFEEPVGGYINIKENKIVFNKEMPQSGGLKFLGKIDRIDITNDQECIIVDYKTGTSDQSNIGSWKSNGEFQLYLYSKAVESGLTSAPAKVAGAFYHSLKNSERRKGFYKNEELPEALQADTRWRPSEKAVLKSEDAEKVIGELEEELCQILKGIQASEFDPKPRDIKSCEKCDWRSHCRAHHLL